jgi:hypothetical protein
LCVADRPDIELDLTGNISQLKKQVNRIILKADRCVCVCVCKYLAFLLLVNLLHCCLLSVHRVFQFHYFLYIIFEA